MLQYIQRNDNPTPFPRPEDMPEALYQLLVGRGIDSAEAAERFLNPDERMLLDPFLLNDMDRAAEALRAAMDAHETICVYGDYDVDGVCAASKLKLWLEARGASVRVYLPSRHTEGYGLNAEAIREIAQWADLLVTVDCGVTSVALVDLAKQLGLKVVVTDHHRPAEQLPDCPVVDPLLNGYPFPHLCGAGVAWKLVWALDGKMPLDFVDIAALATVADVVSLTGENRAIVAMGLRSILKSPRLGIAALIEAAGLSDKPVTSTAIGFQLAPRLNAGGRLGSAMRALELVTASDPAKARALAEALDAENTERRQVEQKILREAEAQLRGFDFIRHRALILCGKDWNPGVIGLAASRLVEQYHYPAILLSDQGDRLTGSCRSIEGVDIHAALTGCADTMIKFGGHRQAAGLALAPERLPDFIDAMDAWLRENVPPEAYIPQRVYDAELDLESVTPGLIAALEALQPTGFGNPAPVFRTRAEVVEARAVGADGAHLKLTLAQDGHRVGGIAFREGGRAAALNAGDRQSPLDVLFVPKLNTFMGHTTAQIEVQALTDANANARLRSNIGDEWAYLCDFLTEILYNKKIATSCPEASVIGWSDLRDRVAASPQGTLMIAGDFQCASRALKALGRQCPPDLYIGELPGDPRAFNALCVCPKPGDIPAGYSCIALIGTPAEWTATDRPLCRLPARPEWADGLPDVEAMRRVYRGLQELTRRPVRFHTMGQLVHLVRAQSDEAPAGALASIVALRDMGLFDLAFDANPARLTRTGIKKADPESSPVWQMIQRWKKAI